MSEHKYHISVAGETLSGIALRWFGDEKEVYKIFQHNPHLIELYGQHDYLKPGTEIEIIY